MRFTCVSNFVLTSRWDFLGLHSPVVTSLFADVKSFVNLADCTLMGESSQFILLLRYAVVCLHHPHSRFTL